MSSIGPDGLKACRGLLSHGLYRASAVMARMVAEQDICPVVRSEVASVMQRAEMAENISRVHQDFIKRSLTPGDKLIFHDVFDPMERAENPYFCMAFQKDVIRPLIFPSPKDIDRANALFDQVANLRMHGGGGIFEVLRRETGTGMVITSLAMDLGPGIPDFLECIIKSMEAHEHVEMWGVPGCVTGMGSLNMFNGCDELLVESTGLAWIKDGGGIDSLFFDKSSVTKGTCVSLKYYINK